ncbi:hypothetical protein NKR23_g1210 [Pleurostoma richardsiae]|uniref:ATP/GTP-binding protein n=1 Tax=Pleurostoma richardsiae TaxID=41990 RepID=A0AA38SD26_9PEZI|nr:hypothetical protein NKR23_g1210 [Pleurostoma richardsiae]
MERGTIPSHIQNLIRRSEDDPRPVVVMMCGIAGAGKTTLTKAILAANPAFTRLSIDAIIYARHGLYAADYPPSSYDSHQDEADILFLAEFRRLLQLRRDLVLDRSFYARADRDDFQREIEAAGARAVLVHLRAGEELLWRRICERSARERNADSALDISRELLRQYVEGFEEPVGEGEIVIDVT